MIVFIWVINCNLCLWEGRAWRKQRSLLLFGFVQLVNSSDLDRETLLEIDRPVTAHAWFAARINTVNVGRPGPSLSFSQFPNPTHQPPPIRLNSLLASGTVVLHPFSHVNRLFIALGCCLLRLICGRRRVYRRSRLQFLKIVFVFRFGAFRQRESSLVSENVKKIFWRPLLFWVIEWGHEECLCK